MKRLLELFWIFIKIGAFTFGGGLAMIPLIEREVVVKKNWITSKEMLDLVAIAESTPGVIALNTATYVGAKVKGFFGSLIASIGVMLPSVVIIILISPVIAKFRDYKLVTYALMGVRSAVVVLILNSVFKLFKSVERNIFTYVIMALACTLATLSAFNVLKFDVVWILVAAAAIGALRGYIKAGRGNKDSENKVKESIQTPVIPQEEKKK